MNALLNGTAVGDVVRMSESEQTAEPSSARVGLTFDVFFRQEFVGMVSLAEAVSGDPAHAEDLAAEAMSRAHEKWETVGRMDKPAPGVGGCRPASGKATSRHCPALSRRSSRRRNRRDS